MFLHTRRIGKERGATVMETSPHFFSSFLVLGLVKVSVTVTVGVAWLVQNKKLTHLLSVRASECKKLFCLPELRRPEKHFLT